MTLRIPRRVGRSGDTDNNPARPAGAARGCLPRQGRKSVRIVNLNRTRGRVRGAMHILLRGSTTQRLRLGSGLILFTFALSHFLIHALGLVSIETMTAAQDWRLLATRSVVGSTVLGAAMLTHIGLALAKLARRATLRLPGWEMTQLLLGLAIPFLLIPHLVDTRLAYTLFGVNDTYIYELIRLWPSFAVDQTVLLLLVWVHACIGLHFWLRLSGWYDRIFPALLAFAVLVPFAALAGFYVAAREAHAIIADPAVFSAVRSATHWPDLDVTRALIAYVDQGRIGFYVMLTFVLLIIAGRWLAARFKPQFAISYVPEPTVRARLGCTLLEVSRTHGIPHLSVCGGRARCSTCRVEIIEGGAMLPPPLGAEAATLLSIHAPVGVRLACQLQPRGPLVVRLLLKPAQSMNLARAEAQGVERTLAILFLDVRGFTTLSEHKLPYDVVFVLNHLFAAAGAAVLAHGGWIDKYLGDGLMAVFGQEVGPEEGCRQALRAARAIDVAIDEVNQQVQAELGAPLRVGIGIHAGPLVLGHIGHQSSASMTVVGKTVNAASRLEALTKDLRCQLVVSSDAARLAGLRLSRYQLKSVDIRGLADPLDVFAIHRARDIPDQALGKPGPRAP